MSYLTFLGEHYELLPDEMGEAKTFYITGYGVHDGVQNESLTRNTSSVRFSLLMIRSDKFIHAELNYFFTPQVVMRFLKAIILA